LLFDERKILKKIIFRPNSFFYFFVNFRVANELISSWWLANWTDEMKEASSSSTHHTGVNLTHYHPKHSVTWQPTSPTLTTSLWFVESPDSHIHHFYQNASNASSNHHSSMTYYLPIYMELLLGLVS